jgi:hypothetical protein
MRHCFSACLAGHACRSHFDFQTRRLAHFCAMADHSLSLSALRVAVYAPRDGEMRALARELAAARRRDLDLADRIEWMEYRHDAYIVALTADNAMLQRQLDARERLLEIARANSFYTNSLRFNRETRLVREGDRLSRWSVERSLEEGVPAPMEVWRAVRLMRQDDEADDDADGEADDDAEMAVDSTAAVP